MDRTNMEDTARLALGMIHEGAEEWPISPAIDDVLDEAHIPDLIVRKREPCLKMVGPEEDAETEEEKKRPTVPGDGIEGLGDRDSHISKYSGESVFAHHLLLPGYGKTVYYISYTETP